MYRRSFFSAGVAVLLSLTLISCGGGDDSAADTETSATVTESTILTTEPITTTAETTTEETEVVTETTAETAETSVVTEETTAAAETLSPEESQAIFDSYAEGRTIIQLHSNEFKSFYDSLPKDGEIVKVILEVIDIPGLYLWVDNSLPYTENYDASYVFYNGDIDHLFMIDFIFDDNNWFVVHKSDEFLVVGVAGKRTRYCLYNSSGYCELDVNSGRDGSIIEFYVENGNLCYRMENPIITKGRDDPSIILENVLSPQTWMEEWGTVDSDFNFIKEGKTTVMHDGYLASLLPYDGIETVSELFERNRAKYDIDIPGVDLAPEHRGLPTYEVNLDMSVPGYEPPSTNSSNHIEDYINHQYFDVGYFPKKFAVAFPDDPGLAMIFEAKVYHQSSYPEIRSYLKYVYYNGTKFDVSNYSIGGFGFELHHTKDILAIIGGDPSSQGSTIFLSKNGMYEQSIEKETGLYFAYKIFKTEDNVLEVKLVPRKIAFARYSGWCLEYESDDLYMIEAVASVTESGVTLTEVSRMTLGEFYESGQPGYWTAFFWGKDDSGATTFDEYKEYVQNWTP